VTKYGRTPSRYTSRPFGGLPWRLVPLSSGWERETLEDDESVASRKLTPSTHDITLKKPAGFSFRPTQFTFLTLRTDEGPDGRPMSLATSPTVRTWNMAVASATRVQRAFASLRPGTGSS